MNSALKLSFLHISLSFILSPTDDVALNSDSGNVVHSQATAVKKVLLCTVSVTAENALMW